MISLRRRLLTGTVGLFVGGWLLVCAITYWTTSLSVNRLYDEELRAAAETALDVIEIGSRIGEPPDEGLRKAFFDAINGPDRLEHPPQFLAWRDEALVLRSDNAPAIAHPSSLGFGDQVADGVPWRTLALHEPHTNVVLLAAEPLSPRRHLTFTLVRDALLPLFIALPLLAALIWVGVGQGLRPLADTAAAIARRSPQRLDRMPTERTPHEVLALIEAINGLLERLEVAFAAERRLTADAAHEIRTPLASLKTHAQVAMRSRDPDVHMRALAQTTVAVDRLTLLMEQVLTLARVDAGSLNDGFVDLDLHDVARSVLADLAPDAIDRGIELELADGRWPLRGNDVFLGVLLRNLVQNAVRYTPAGGQVTVRALQDDRALRLQVDDTGPGIPADERERVFQRFYRGASSASGSGSGLGLPIVLRIAELHGAEVRLDDAPDGGGLRVEVLFPRAG